MYIGKENQALSTYCEIASAEAAVEHARLYLRFEEPRLINIGMVDQQAAKLRTARAYLELAERGLGRGGRHILLWRAFALARGNMIVCALRNDVMRHTCAGERWSGLRGRDAGEARAGRLWRTLRDGLQVVRDGLDHTPAMALRFQAGFFEVWHELLVYGFIAYTVLRRNIVGKEAIDRFSTIAAFWDVWMQMNTQADLPIDRIDGLKALVGRLLDDLLRPHEANEGVQVREMMCAAVDSLQGSHVLGDFWQSYGRDWVSEVC